jgi:hypothetical protein
MANLVRHHFGWVGHGFEPGVEHGWWFGPISFGTVVYVTAHPIGRSPERSPEAMVKDIRTRVDNTGNRTLLFAVRNTGANSIVGYGLDFRVVSN